MSPGALVEYEQDVSNYTTNRIHTAGMEGGGMNRVVVRNGDDVGPL